jgi:hypothetical protein
VSITAGRRPHFSPQQTQELPMTVLPRRGAADTQLRHGFTLSQVQALSVFAVQRDSWHHDFDFNDRLEAAWHAIIEHIYSSAEPPTVREIIRTGWRAIGEHVEKEHRFHGRNTHDRYAGTTGKFERYWRAVAGTAPGPEERIIELLALAQIWPRLRPVYREVLAALAAHDDYGLAAEALGKRGATFRAQVSLARKEFLELWHEGESPSRPWGTDRRIARRTGRHSASYRAITSRRRRQSRRLRAVQDPEPPCEHAAARSGTATPMRPGLVTPLPWLSRGARSAWATPEERFAQVLAETLKSTRPRGQSMGWASVQARRRIGQLGPALTEGLGAADIAPVARPVKQTLADKC